MPKAPRPRKLGSPNRTSDQSKRKPFGADKERALQLIGKYAGPHWREAQRVKWIIDMVKSIHAQYASDQAAQASHVDALQAELSRAYDTMREQEQASAREVATLAERLNQTRLGEVEANQKALAAQSRAEGLHAQLHKAEKTAAAAADECNELREEVREVAETGFRARQSLSSRTHQLREALVDSRREVRTKRKHLRTSRTEIWKCKSQRERLAEHAASQKVYFHQEKSALLKRLASLSREAQTASELAADAALLVGKRNLAREVAASGEDFRICGVGC